jgi:uncharacterized membrane protein
MHRQVLVVLAVVAVVLAILGAGFTGLKLGGPVTPAHTEKTRANAGETKAQEHTKAQKQALMNVRVALPALGAWQQDHGTYRGATVMGLHQYDYGVRNIRFVHATRTSYCIESRVGDAVASVKGPDGMARPVACGH